MSKRPSNPTKLGGYLHNYSVNISPRDLSQKINGSWEIKERSKWIGVFSRTQKQQFGCTRDSRGFSTWLERSESPQRAKQTTNQRTCLLQTLNTQKRRIQVQSAKEEGEDENSAHKSELIRFKSPEGTRRIGPPFPNKSNPRSQQSMIKTYSKERNRGRETQGRRPGELMSPRTEYKSRN